MNTFTPELALHTDRSRLMTKAELRADWRCPEMRIICVPMKATASRGATPAMVEISFCTPWMSANRP